jgi:asparagine synthetase B (glutamine-hydrolysing)
MRLIDWSIHGPDCQKTWISSRRNVGFGHARLSIIDLTTGDQPIANETGSLHIIVNGEFYDYERIQRELHQRGHQLRTRTDSEIALHLYEQLQIKLFLLLVCRPHGIRKHFFMRRISVIILIKHSIKTSFKFRWHIY